MCKTILIVLCVFVLSASCDATPPYTQEIDIGKTKLYAQVVTTPAEMQQGLSDRISMSENQGMLFIFPASARPGFWMKDMKFDLDLIWIKDNKIIFITPNVPSPKSSAETLPLYYPPSAVNQVLEVNSGWSKKNNIAAGDDVTLTW